MTIALHPHKLKPSLMICIPIKDEQTNKILLKMELAAPKADVLEIWIDQIKDLNLFKIIQSKPLPLIIVNKPIREKGDFTGSEENRVELLMQAIDLGADYIDIGIDTSTKLIKKLVQHNKKRAKIIISYHNFRSTPDEEELSKIIDKSYRLKADIVKIATKANTYEDNIKIFNILKKYKSKKKKVIGLCMGDRGKMSRVVAPLIGSHLTFAPLEIEQSTAPGQLTVTQLERLWDVLGK
jgi:3-dehydroquinate dehydratase type I